MQKLNMILLFKMVKLSTRYQHMYNQYREILTPFVFFQSLHSLSQCNYPLPLEKQRYWNLPLFLLIRA